MLTGNGVLSLIDFIPFEHVYRPVCTEAPEFWRALHHLGRDRTGIRLELYRIARRPAERILVSSWEPRTRFTVHRPDIADAVQLEALIDWLSDQMLEDLRV